MTDDPIRQAIDGAEPPDPGDDDALWRECPVVCLGHRTGTYHFLDAAGQKIEYSIRDFTALGILSLFAGNKYWLVKKFPHHDRDGKPTGDFGAKAAAAGLMRRCAAGGLFSGDTPLRGVGVWRGASVNRIVAHVGDALITVERDRIKFATAGKHFEGAIYPAAPPVIRPAKKPATAHQARQLYDAIGLWNYADRSAQRFIFGQIAQGMLGAAPDWRVHILIRGQRGTGKTKLAEIALAALGPQCLTLNDFTEAGLRQLITGEGRAIMLDEAEGDTQNNRLDAVIQFLRRISGGEGLQGVRGGSAGTPQRFAVASSAWLFAINAPALLPQDRSRILEIDLAKPTADREAAVFRSIDAAAEISPALRSRALLGWARFRDNLAVIRAALGEAGCDARQADKFGTLLAAAEMMLHDAPIDSDSAAEMVRELTPMLVTARAEDDEDSEARQCLITLLTRQIEHWRGGSKSTIGRILTEAIDDAGQEKRDALKVYGLRLEIRDGAARLIVADRHEGLTAIFRDTRWRNGGWRVALKNIDGASAAPHPVRFDSGLRVRAVVVPLDHLMRRDAPADSAPRPGAVEGSAHDAGGAHAEF